VTRSLTVSDRDNLLRVLKLNLSRTTEIELRKKLQEQIGRLTPSADEAQVK